MIGAHVILLGLRASLFLCLCSQLPYSRDPKVFFTKDSCKWESLAEGMAFCVFLIPVVYPFLFHLHVLLFSLGVYSDLIAHSYESSYEDGWVGDVEGNEDCHTYCYSSIKSYLARRMEFASSIMYSASSDVCSVIQNTLNTQNTLWAQLCYSATSQTQPPLDLSSTHVSVISHGDDISQSSDIQESPSSTTSLASFQELVFGFGGQFSTSLQHTQSRIQSLCRC
jgi:hypothetical protein